MGHMIRLGLILLYLATLAGGLYLAYRPAFDSGFDRVPAELVDGMLNHYILEHTWQVLTNRAYCGSLYSPPFFFPERLVLVYSENLFGAAPVYWLLRLVLPFDLAYPAWMIACSVLNFAAFALVTRWLGCSHPVAALGGFLWAFAVVHVRQAFHQQMIPQFGSPLAVYHAWRFAVHPNPKSLNRMLAFTFFQFLICINTGWFLAVGLATFVPAVAAGFPGGLRALVRFGRENRGQVVRIVGLWAVAFAVLLGPYFVVNRHHARQYAECVLLMPTVATWFAGPPGSPWQELLPPEQRPPIGELELFSGFGVYLLILAAGIYALRTRRTVNGPSDRVLLLACCLTVAVWWLLTLNLGDGISGWWLVRFLPGGGAIRCVARVYTVVYLFGTLAGVVGLDRAVRRFRPRWQAIAVLAVAVPIVYEQTGFTPFSMERAAYYPAVDRVAASLRGADAGAVVPNFGDTEYEGNVFGMWVGLRANVPVVDGYSGRFPDSYPLSGRTLDDVALRNWLAGRFRGPVAVVDPLQPGQVRFIGIE